MNRTEAHFNYILRLADSNLILGHRLSEWCGHAPYLEEDIAMANIALDMIGQANALYVHAAKLEGKGRTEDDLAYMRNEREYYNTLLSEQKNTDFAYTIMRQFLADVFDHHLFKKLESSTDVTLAALAVKGGKEVTYHLRHTSAWMERLGGGTEESHRRLQNALNFLWGYTADMFELSDSDRMMVKEGIAVDPSAIQAVWLADIKTVCKKANLEIPEKAWQHSGSREGKHTEHLG
ncbi:MAG TPA: 1,2-phenylacetyl-CoA epoxidase subunit PaaC, partial [Bacteroidia bacterium]|nr:1,2-phenylacetyl-CoA epoxidase subunit PaaC [Bacteroidia bacterium]